MMWVFLDPLQRYLRNVQSTLIHLHTAAKSRHNPFVDLASINGPPC